MPTINTRVKNKHDTEANWSKSNLVPLNGEIIIFEADDNTPYPRFKVGDGETKINNLPFIDSDYVKQDELGNYVTTDNVNQSINNKCILYTEAQTLTEEQKNQARTNIGINITNINDAVVTLGAALTYNGSEQTQEIQSVVLDGIPLVEGIDYIVINNKQTNAGTYTLSVIGKFPYSGSVQKNWTIAKAAVPGFSVNKQSVFILGASGTETVTVSATVSGTVSAQSSAPSVVTATVSGMTVTMTGQTNGSATVTITFNAGSNYNVATTNVGVTVSNELNLASWEKIRDVADNDLGESYWAVGDTKAITLNGTVGTKSYSNVTVWVYIIGFNHNASLEGEHLIHFGCFKTAKADGVDIALDDSHYNSNSTNGAKWFNINHWGNYTYGGWSRCDMRYDILGSTDVAPEGYGASASMGEEGKNPTSTCATSPIANTLMAAFPADLRAVMKPATKYTNNSGNGDTSSTAVTATQDYLPLLSEYELMGFRSEANSYEGDYQEQYAYYANGNSKIKYMQSSTELSAPFWLRSPDSDGQNAFCFFQSTGRVDAIRVGWVFTVSPIFFV